MNPFSATVVAIILIALSGLLFLHAMRHGRSRPLSGAFVVIALLGLWVFSDFGRMHRLYPRHEAYRALRGEESRKALLHLHDFFHYYLGAKYFKELGYDGLYAAFALADSVSESPVLSTTHMRDQKTLLGTVQIDAERARATREILPRFTAPRWQEFQGDVAYLKSISRPKWFDKIMYDSGFNPPPSWLVLGFPVANLFPISERWIDPGPMVEPAELLASLDLLLLATAAVFVYRAFGFLGFMAFAVTLGTSGLVNYSWNVGSMLRFLWLFGLIMGIAQLKRERYFSAGAFLGLSCAAVLFPFVFYLGAALSLLCLALFGNRGWRPLVGFCLGGASAVSVLVLASLAMFGVDAWRDFVAEIDLHSSVYFTNHIGYRRVAVFDPDILNQDFWWADGISRFADWNADLSRRWEEQRFYQYPLMGLLMAVTALASSRVRPEEGALLFGSMTLFLFALPANYYYIYFALVAAAIVRESASLESVAIAAALFAVWAFFWIVPHLHPDDIMQNFLTSCALLGFLVLWALVRAAGAIRGLRSPARPEPAEAIPGTAPAER